MNSALWSAFEKTGEPLLWLYERELLKRADTKTQSPEGKKPRA